MLVPLTFAVTLAAVCVATSARDIIVLDDEPVYRYYDAVKKCADNGHELAWPHILERKIEERKLMSCFDCGWTSNRYVPSRPRCRTNDLYVPVGRDDCEPIPDNGVSEVGLIVYCQTADAPTDLTNEYNYNVVFVPKKSETCYYSATDVNEAKDLCTGLGARLAYENQLERYEGYEHCDCAWVREVRGVYKFGCNQKTSIQCAHVLNMAYPVYCFGVPPIGECEKNQPCGENETCRNTEDGFECLCSNSGYGRNGAGVCVWDSDPCDGSRPAVLDGYNVECRDGMILIQHGPSCDTPNRVDFVKNWVEYVNGFGTTQTGYWAGLELMHQLTTQHNFQLVIELHDTAGVSYFGQWDNVVIGPASDKYRLSFDAYSVPAGKTDSLDAMTTMHWRQQFSTIDRDNDLVSGYSCSQGGGGWWYSACGYASLNGRCDGRYWGWTSSSPDVGRTWMMLRKTA